MDIIIIREETKPHPNVNKENGLCLCNSWKLLLIPQQTNEASFMEFSQFGSQAVVRPGELCPCSGLIHLPIHLLTELADAVLTLDFYNWEVLRFNLHYPERGFSWFSCPSRKIMG